MKVLKNLSLMVLLALAFAGCRGKSSQLADFNKQLYAPEYASGFKIERADGRQSVLVSVMNPWQGADSVTTRLFISRNGEPVPEGFDGQVLEGDAQRIVAMSSTHIAMLDAMLAMTDIVVNLWSLGVRPDADKPLGIICEGFRLRGQTSRPCRLLRRRPVGLDGPSS